ncbi:MAG TPA: transcription antitermination factor NusB [Clostridiales bacterium]|jgi:N utilization substance protein B|nr:transcription antitermination factor NusB [Clostridiales bacterium]
MSRIQAREKAFLLIFEYLFHRNKSEITLNNIVQDLSFTDDDRQYIKTVYEGVIANYERLENIIAQYSEGFAINRIFRIDLGILLLALYELLYMDDIPVSVTCNEAVNLTKAYSTEKSPSYVNGILANIIKKEGINK